MDAIHRIGRLRIPLIVLLTLVGVCGLLPADAEQVVNSLQDVLVPAPGQVTLRSALDQAADGESIVFDPTLDGCTIELSFVDEEHSTLVGEVMGMTNEPSGPISYLVGYFELDYGRSALYARKNVVLDASTLPLGITIAWGGGDADPARVLAVYGDLTLKNVSVTGGRSLAIELPTPDPEDEYAQLSTRARGGGIAVWGVAHLENCRLYDNACVMSPFTPARSRDSGVFGGGMYADIVQISDCVISGNSLSAVGVSGGGVFSVGGAQASESVSTVERSAITGNRITGIFTYGGGVYSDGGGIGKLKTLKLLNCTIAGNQVDILGLPFLYQSGYWRGGGVYVSNGRLALQSSTVVANEVYGVPRTNELGKPNLAGGIAATIGNAHAAESMTIGHSIIAGNTVHELGGAVYNQDIFTGSLFEFVSQGHNRIGAINFSQILVPIGERNWYSLCRRHYPKQGDQDEVDLAVVLDLSGGVTYSSDILSAGVNASNPVVLHYAPRGNAVDQVPSSSYFLSQTRAEYWMLAGDDNFLEIMLRRLENQYSLTDFAYSFTTNFEAFLAAVDIDTDTPGNQPYTDPDGSPILTLAKTLWFGPVATWPSKLYNYPYIEFWHRLDVALGAEDIAGMGPELLGDDAWMALFESGTLAENSNIEVLVYSAVYSASPTTLDQTLAVRPVNGVGDIGAVEFEPPASPLLYWALEEGAGTNTAETVSGETNIAVLTGSCGWTNGIATDGSNAVFLGVNSSIDAGTLKTNGAYVAGSDPDCAVLSNSWTITAWGKLASRQGITGDRAIVAADNWSLFSSETDGPAEHLGFDFNSTRIESSVSAPTETDLFVAISGDSTASAEHRFAMWDGVSWQFGTGTEFSSLRLQGIELGGFNSTVDDVRIYGQALDQVELDRMTLADTDGDGEPDYLDSDDDNDGLTDADEAAIATNSKNPDSDGDGFEDGDEVIAGTHPMESSSVFRFDDITSAGSNLVIGWSSASNRTYSLWRASDLISNDWEIIDSGITSTVPFNVYTEDPRLGRRFFRVDVE